MNQQPETRNQKPETAVVVNDDPTQLNVLAGLLRKEGIDATAFENAETALTEMNASRPPDLIVTDLYMPGIDGWRFCRLLRSPEYEAFNTVPILVVSATFSGEETSRIAADLGANAFLPSPVDGRRFIDTIRAVRTGEKPREFSRVLVVEDSKTLARLLVKRFEEHGYQADGALSRREASMRLTEVAYDIAVLDYHLPDGSGDMLLQEIRMKRPNCVCVMMTTDPDPKLALAWMKDGAAAYLRKPFDPEYLIEQCVRARRERALLRAEDLLEERTRSLRKREAEQRILLDTIDTQVWYLTDMETYGRLNRAHADFLGFDAKDIAHKRLAEFVSKSVAETCKASNIEVFHKKRPVHTEEWIPNADGEKRLIAITKTPKLDANGHVEYVVCAGTDITERVQAEEALRKSEERFKGIFTSSPIGIELYDACGGLTLANPACLEIFGITDIAQIKGFKLLDDPNVSDDVKAGLSRGETVQYEVSFDFELVKKQRLYETSRSGTMTLDVLITPIIREGKDPDGYLVHIQDLTERVRLQQRLKMLVKNESLERMTGAIAHLFNNHLAAVIGNLELLADDLQSGNRGDENLKEAQTAAHRAAETSGLMLTFLGRSEGKPVPVDLVKACRRCLAELEADKPGGCKIICDLPDSGPVIRVDRFYLDQIISALVTNAWESTNKAVEVCVSINTTSASDIPDTHRFPLDWEPNFENYACLRIADIGRGMDDTTIGRIFDPFFTDKFTGRGLGLPVVLGIVRASEGCVTVESEPGRGSVFQVFWPLSSVNIPGAGGRL